MLRGLPVTATRQSSTSDERGTTLQCQLHTGQRQPPVLAVCAATSAGAWPRTTSVLIAVRSHTTYRQPYTVRPQLSRSKPAFTPTPGYVIAA
ncbi:hypothetical protein VTO73DRAFT_9546 [Trametes versicolor]